MPRSQNHTTFREESAETTHSFQEWDEERIRGLKHAANGLFLGTIVTTLFRFAHNLDDVHGRTPSGEEAVYSQGGMLAMHMSCGPIVSAR